GEGIVPEAAAFGTGGGDAAASGVGLRARYRGPPGLASWPALVPGAQAANFGPIRVEAVNEQPSCARLGRPEGLPYCLTADQILVGLTLANHTPLAAFNE